jgi:hypothetical protein
VCRRRKSETASTIKYLFLIKRVFVLLDNCKMHGQFEHKIKVTLNIHSVRLIPTTFLDILHRITVLLHVRTTANQTSNFLSSVLSFQCIFELVKRRMNSEKVSYNRFRIFGFPICVQKQSLKYIEIKFFVVVCMSVKLVLSC